VKAILILIGVVVVAGIFFVLLKRRGSVGSSKDLWPFYVKKVLTQPEEVLYHRLVAAIPECIVLAQVQLSQVLGVKKGFNFNEWNNRINRMSVDFLVCLKDSTIVAVIELDDKTHEKPSRIEADAKKSKALADAGVTLIRWHVNAMPDEASIRRAFVK
jgi:hypothetical protein